jgi:hypothetical protein
VYCTGLRASWSELAYMSGHCLLQKQSPFSCAVRGLGGCNKRRRSIHFVIWRAGCSGRRGRQARRRGCREKGFSFSELARRPAQLPQPGGRRGGLAPCALPSPIDCAAGPEILAAGEAREGDHEARSQKPEAAA